MAAGPRTWLGPSLAVALLWAPLPGVAAVWYAVRAERAEAAAAARLAARARVWLVVAVAFGFAELLGVGALAAVRALMTWGAT